MEQPPINSFMWHKGGENLQFLCSEHSSARQESQAAQGCSHSGPAGTQAVGAQPLPYSPPSPQGTLLHSGREGGTVHKPA